MGGGMGPLTLLASFMYTPLLLIALNAGSGNTGMMGPLWPSAPVVWPGRGLRFKTWRIAMAWAYVHVNHHSTLAVGLCHHRVGVAWASGCHGPMGPWLVYPPGNSAKDANPW